MNYVKFCSLCNLFAFYIVAIPAAVWMQSMSAMNQSGLQSIFICLILGACIEILCLLTFRIYMNWNRELNAFRLRARTNAQNMHLQLNINESETAVTSVNDEASNQSLNDGEYGEYRSFARRRRTFWEDLFYGCCKCWLCTSGCFEECWFYFCGCCYDPFVALNESKHYHIDLDNDAKYKIICEDVYAPKNNSMGGADADYLKHSLMSQYDKK